MLYGKAFVIMLFGKKMGLLNPGDDLIPDGGVKALKVCGNGIKGKIGADEVTSLKICQAFFFDCFGQKICQR